MKAKDVMTRDVVSIGPERTIVELARLLLSRGVSGVPVIDGDRLVGVVSEGDLIRRAEIGTDERRRSWWLRLFASGAALARDYTKSHAERVRDVMTTEVVVVDEETPLADVAAVLESKRIRRVPVVRRGRVLGVVARADLVRGLAAAKSAATASTAERDDRAIREKVVAILRAQPWSTIAPADVSVAGGVVRLRGVYASEEERRAARVAAESVAGIGMVEDQRTRMPETYGYA